MTAVAVPGGVGSALDMARNVSHVMFGFYFAGIGFSAVSLIVGQWICCSIPPPRTRTDSPPPHLQDASISLRTPAL